jgi:hypothetical protein
MAEQKYDCAMGMSMFISYKYARSFNIEIGPSNPDTLCPMVAAKDFAMWVEEYVGNNRTGDVRKM